MLSVRLIFDSLLRFNPKLHCLFWYVSFRTDASTAQGCQQRLNNTNNNNSISNNKQQQRTKQYNNSITAQHRNTTTV